MHSYVRATDRFVCWDREKMEVAATGEARKQEV